MTQVNKHLASILENIKGQKANVDANLAAAEQAAFVASPEAQAAIELLVEQYKDVQVIGKIIGAQMALKQLRQAQDEIAVLEATLSVVSDDAVLTAKVQQKQNADLIREVATG